MKRLLILFAGIVSVVALVLLVVAIRPAGAASTAVIGPATDNGLHVVTWNLRKDVDPAPLRWADRRDRVAQVLWAEQPTILAVQELRDYQLSNVRDALPGYAMLAVNPTGAADGGYVAVFYDTRRLVELDHHHSWLSTTPQTPYSVSWGASQARAATWIKFRDLRTGRKFALITAHFDHVSAKAREKSAAIIDGKARRLGRHMPVIFAGDTNAAENTSSAWGVLNSGPLRGTWNAGGEQLTDRWDTFNRWQPYTQRGKRIDWIMTDSRVRVRQIAINPTPYLDGFATDHLPVQALLELR